MPTKTKIDPKKTAEEAKNKATATANAAKDKLTNNQVTKAAGDVFSKIQAKTGLSQEKVDAFQKSWLGMPQTRKKYEHLKDAPEVVGEELIAMSNDIIDFVQGQGGGQSHVFKKLKEEGSSFFKHPIDYISGKVDKGVDSLMAGKNKAMEGAAKAKDMAGKATDAAANAKGMVGKAAEVAEKAKEKAKKIKK
ncbi:hypothetical protein JW758_06395 [Candidatus Peregrinibacteria bacterium]|nr:hypothetical protein [Candidatus Peregrinibacteria bacterium]